MESGYKVYVKEGYKWEEIFRGGFSQAREIANGYEAIGAKVKLVSFGY